MTAAQYARSTRTTMWNASGQLVKDYKEGKLKFHHNALVRGYTSVKGDEYAEYEGRFGRGIAVFSHYTSYYSKVSYYMKEETENE